MNSSSIRAPGTPFLFPKRCGGEVSPQKGGGGATETPRSNPTESFQPSSSNSSHTELPPGLMKKVDELGAKVSKSIKARMSPAIDERMRRFVSETPDEGPSEASNSKPFTPEFMKKVDKLAAEVRESAEARRPPGFDRRMKEFLTPDEGPSQASLRGVPNDGGYIIA
jgi:predicted transcriptional regulator